MTRPLESVVYLSDDKISELYEQVGTKERDHSLSINIPWFKWEIRTKPSGPRIHEKLVRVLNELESSVKIGTVREPREYFAGELVLTWGCLGDADSNVVFFSTSDHTSMIALGGSARNVRGGPGSTGAKRTSNLSALAEVLYSAQGTSLANSLSIRFLRQRSTARAEDWELEAIEQAVLSNMGVKQNVRFVAKTLLEGRSRDGLRILLGTPLIVSSAE